MIAKAFEFNGRRHLELNLSTAEARRLQDVLWDVEASSYPPETKTVFTKLINAIARGWKVKPE